MTRPFAGNLFVRAALFVATVCVADGREWRWITPRIASEVVSLRTDEASVLLSEFCVGAVKVRQGIGPTCLTRRYGEPAFSNLIDDTFHPEGVIYGHFLSPTSEDATVSGWSSESHPALWGGTLLLTRKSGKWMPAWYRSSVLTHSCQKVVTPGGRELLLCEEEDAGMGAQVHYLYSVDLTHPKDVRETLLTQAFSFADGCTIRKQIIDHVTWSQADWQLTISLSTPEWRYVRVPACEGNWLRRDKRRTRVSISTFELSDSGFVANRPDR